MTVPTRRCLSLHRYRADTKLVSAYHLGKRDAYSTDQFIGKLRYATSDRRYQLTSDGFKPYVSAVKMLLRDRVDLPN